MAWSCWRGYSRWPRSAIPRDMDCWIIQLIFFVVVPWFPAKDTNASGPACNTLFAAVCPVILPWARATWIRRCVGRVVVRLVALACSASSRTFPCPMASFVADGAHFRQGLRSRQGRRTRHRRSLWLGTLWRAKPYRLAMIWRGRGGKGTK